MGSPSITELRRERASWSRLCHRERERAEASEAKAEQLLELLRRVEPHLDAIVCYASDMGEHEPNQIAFDIRKALEATAPEGSK